MKLFFIILNGSVRWGGKVVGEGLGMSIERARMGSKVVQVAQLVRAKD